MINNSKGWTVWDTLALWLLSMFAIPGMIFGAWFGWQSLFPVERWYEFTGMHIPDTTLGEAEIIVLPVRTVHRSFMGSRYITLWDAESFTAICEGGPSSIRYDDRSELPAPVTLAWWTRLAVPNCMDALYPGTFLLTSCMTVQMWQPFIPERTLCVDSNIFRVLP